jgi:hypothetical protein
VRIDRNPEDRLPDRGDGAHRGHAHRRDRRQGHLMRLGFEKYFLWKMRDGYVQLP